VKERGSVPTSALVYKILTQVDWQQAGRSGSYAGSQDDMRDGFIHLSGAHQVAATAQRHFRGMDGLVLLALDARRLGEALKWEPSRGGDLFPHFYGPLPIAAVLWSKPLALGPDGVPVMPEEVGTC
jgi:uncharacterized protein (DUF952 family)